MKNNPFNNIPSADGQIVDATDIREELTREVRQTREMVELAANILINEDGTARDFLQTKNQEIILNIALTRMESIRDSFSRLAKTIPSEIQVRFDDEDRTLLNRTFNLMRGISHILIIILFLIVLICGFNTYTTDKLSNLAEAALELISQPRPASADDISDISDPAPSKSPVLRSK